MSRLENIGRPFMTACQVGILFFERAIHHQRRTRSQLIRVLKVSTASICPNGDWLLRKLLPDGEGGADFEAYHRDCSKSKSYFPVDALQAPGRAEEIK